MFIVSNLLSPLKLRALPTLPTKEPTSITLRTTPQCRRRPESRTSPKNPTSSPTPTPSAPVSTPTPPKRQPPDRETLLLSELQAPFRGPRMFISGSLGFSAFIAFVIALFRGFSGSFSTDETLLNVVVNILGISFFGWLFIGDLKRREKDLQRIGGRIRVGDLMVEVSGGRVVKLKDVVGKRRIVIVSGAAEDVREIVRGKGGEKSGDLICVVGGDGSRVAVGGKAGKGIAKVRDECEGRWMRWLDEERFDVGIEDRRNAVLVTIVEKNGQTKRLPKGQTEWAEVPVK